LILFFLIAIVITIMPNIFGSVELTTNMTNDSFEPEYEAATELVHIDMTILVITGFIILVGGLLLVFYYMMK
jgi:hypothetical protein